MTDSCDADIDECDGLWRDVLEICSGGWLGLWVCEIVREGLR